MSELTHAQIDQIEERGAGYGGAPDVRNLIDTTRALRTQLADRDAELDGWRTVAETNCKIADEQLGRVNALITELECVKSQMASEYEMDMNEQLRKVRERDARIARLEEALMWVLNLCHGVSKFSSYGFHHGVTGQELQDALEAGKQALAQEEP